MFCHKCGSEINAGSDFCYKCGTKMTGNSTTQSQYSPQPNQSASYKNYQTSAGAFSASQTGTTNAISEASKRVRIISLMGIALACLLAICAIVVIYDISVINAQNAYYDEVAGLFGGEVDRSSDSLFYTDTSAMWIDVVLFTALSVYSFIVYIKSLGFSKAVVNKPSGILETYYPFGKFIIPLAGYGVLLIFSLITVWTLAIVVCFYALVVGILNITYVRKYVLSNQTYFQSK